MKILLCLLLPLCTLEVNAQGGSLKGRVTEGASGIPGVNIILQKTDLGAQTSSEGNYEVKSIPEGTYSVRFSAIGYETILREVTVKRGTVTLNVEMKPSVIVTDEVQVLGDRRQKQEDPRVSVIDLRPEKARVQPGAVQDVLRTLQSLPGVLAPNDFTSQLVIRGSGPDQNLIIMDDVEVFNPYRLYGVISMFNPEAVADINLITGGFPARYGDRLSAVLDVTNREGPRNAGFKGNINASIVDANLVLEGKNPFSVPGSWIINSRRTYYDLIIEPFVKKAGLVEENTSFPNFYDFQGKLAFGPFGGHRFLLNGIISRDGVNVISGKKRKTPDSVSVQDLSRNDLASFAWHYSPSKRLLNKFIVSWYKNSGDSQLEAAFLDPSLNRDKFNDAVPDTISSYLLGIGVTSSFFFRKYSYDDKFTYLWGSNQLEAGVGLDQMRTTIDFNFNLSPALKAFIESNGGFRSIPTDIKDIKDYYRYRAYVQNNFRVSERLYVEPGLRMDYYQILQKPYLAPRIAVSYALNDITTLRAVWGVFYQSPGYEKLRDQNMLLDFSPQYTRSLRAERAIHYVLSLERWLNEEWRAKAEGYYKRFNNLIVPEKVQGRNFFTEPVPGKDARYPDAWTRPVYVRGDSVTQIPINNSDGEAYGFEFLLEKRNIAGSNVLSGWISYALAFANRYEDGMTIPFRYDQRHTVNVVLSYEVSRSFNIGLRWQFGSGFPYTVPLGIKPRIILTDTNLDGKPDSPEIATRQSGLNSKPQVIYDVNYGINAERYNAKKPDYHRLDVRFTWLAEFWNLDWSFYLDVINVYNRHNVVGYSYFINDDLTLGRRVNTMFPIIPTFGFSVKF
ncbi:MAG: TonB-dependent receptor [Ignavibacteria bacterium]|nr:TonB-dependent receptor [Ignavibacteria bacterium]MCU7519363.1 TonB-dependent receptor [Ignavibacteria bacterium]